DAAARRPYHQRMTVKKSKAKPAKARAKKKAAATKPADGAALRSRAFGKAILRSRSYTLSPQRLAQLVQAAALKTAGLPREPFRESWAYLHAMLRLLRAYGRGDYDKVSGRALLSVVAAVAYLVDPVDFIPDEVPFFGYLDDATVLEFAIQKTRKALDDFMVWELARLLAGSR
ncbi:MAG TPA: DUF1232 domain-containing protein, partial [Chthoniobacterales bacterium]